MSDPDTPTRPKGPTYATDHLANERTFLAWVRTSLAVIGLGFAVAKFGTWLRHMAGPASPGTEATGFSASLIVGFLMIATGGGLAVLAAARYNAVAKQIESGRVRSASTTVAAVPVIVLLLAAAVGFLTLNGTAR